MATNPEAILEAFFNKRIRILGGSTHKLISAETGMPDRLVLMPGGRIYLVELKTDTGTRSPGQVEWHRKAAQRGVRVYTVHGRVGVLAWLRLITEEHRQDLLRVEKRARRAGLERV